MIDSWGHFPHKQVKAYSKVNECTGVAGDHFITVPGFESRGRRHGIYCLSLAALFNTCCRNGSAAETSYPLYNGVFDHTCNLVAINGSCCVVRSSVLERPRGKSWVAVPHNPPANMEHKNLLGPSGRNLSSCSPLA